MICRGDACVALNSDELAIPPRADLLRRRLGRLRRRVARDLDLIGRGDLNLRALAEESDLAGDLDLLADQLLRGVAVFGTRVLVVLGDDDAEPAAINPFEVDEQDVPARA